VGIDLNPGADNRYVVHGDFHDLQFAPGSIDVVYTNSLDHAFDIDRIAKEVLKVLKPDGVFLVEAVQGRDQGTNPGFFESFFWKNIDELVAALENAGFTVSRRTSITAPWPGEQICLQRTAISKSPT
jgi:ubiquinone/menaquinone biosynthesis C-methylase UbiE